MSVKQDRYTFFGVLAAVVIVVLGYLQLGRLYPVAGRADHTPDDKTFDSVDAEHHTDQAEGAHFEGDARP